MTSSGVDILRAVCRLQATWCGCCTKPHVTVDEIERHRLLCAKETFGGNTFHFA